MKRECMIEDLRAYAAPGSFNANVADLLENDAKALETLRQENEKLRMMLHTVDELENTVVTNGDDLRYCAGRFARMTDTELADYICDDTKLQFCERICGNNCTALPTMEMTAREHCRRIVLAWLKTPPQGGKPIED